MSGTLEGGRRTRGEQRTGGERPLVSIVTVVYNGAETLERTIRSVLEQRYTPIEYIIVDGGSTDGTLDILRRYDDRLDLWVSARDKGIYDAMNKGVALCTGEWIGLINADDWYEPDAVRLAMDAAGKEEAVNIVHGDIMIHYPNGTNKVKRPKRSGFLLKYWEMVLNHPSFFVRSAYYAGRPFDTTLRVSGDHKWTLEAWMEDRAHFRYVPLVLAHFSAGGASMTNPLGKVIREGVKVGKDVGLNRRQRWLGSLVRTGLYLPSWAKLRFNQFIAPLLKKRT